jgi:hypothetical protein
VRYLSVCSGTVALDAKLCAKCGASKSLADFHKQPSGQFGRHSWCKDCYNTYARETRNRKVSPEQRAKNNLWTRYRLRPEEVERMLADQGGVCAICSEPPRRPVVDHNHETGEVRGILCHGCNIALPHVEDAQWLRLALAYLGRGE